MSNAGNRAALKNLADELAPVLDEKLNALEEKLSAGTFGFALVLFDASLSDDPHQLVLVSNVDADGLRAALRQIEQKLDDAGIGEWKS